MLSRYSNRTVTLTLLSLKYSNRRVAKKTAQLQSNHLIGSSARIKSPSDISVRVKSP